MLDTQLSLEQSTLARQLVTELQAERLQVWNLYCQIAELKPAFTSTEIRPILSNFLQIMIDYVSLGHFGVYERLLNQAKQAADLSRAEKLYPAFSSTTASAISFNERYDNGKRSLKVDTLAEDLSALGENLAKRMELEDRLCSMLLH